MTNDIVEWISKSEWKDFRSMARLSKKIIKCSEQGPIKRYKGELNYKKDSNSSK